MLKHTSPHLSTQNSASYLTQTHLYKPPQAGRHASTPKVRPWAFAVPHWSVDPRWRRRRGLREGPTQGTRHAGRYHVGAEHILEEGRIVWESVGEVVCFGG